MTRDPFLDRADFVQQWREMIEKPLAGEQQVKPPILTAPVVKASDSEAGDSEGESAERDEIKALERMVR